MEVQTGSTLVVAIDGTAGSGKSSASRGVARRLGLRYLDTGAMYRAITVWMLRHHVDVHDPHAVARAAASAAPSLVESGTDPDRPTITLAGEDVSREIRSGPVTAAVSAVSAAPPVRALLVQLQRDLIGCGGIVVEGRDIGTVVVPDAEVKVYLTADPVARARRRRAELSGADGLDLADVQQHLEHRDSYDSTRAADPLSAASNAVHLDSTELTLTQVVDAVEALVRACGAEVGTDRATSR